MGGDGAGGVINRYGISEDNAEDVTYSTNDKVDDSGYLATIASSTDSQFELLPLIQQQLKISQLLVNLKEVLQKFFHPLLIKV